MIDIYFVYFCMIDILIAVVSYDSKMNPCALNMTNAIHFHLQQLYILYLVYMLVAHQLKISAQSKCVVKLFASLLSSPKYKIANIYNAKVTNAAFAEELHLLLGIGNEISIAHLLLMRNFRFTLYDINKYALALFHALF